MTATVVSVDVDRSAAQVFAFATDPTRFSQWQSGVVSGHLEPAPDTGADPIPPGVGARCVTTRRIASADRTSTAVITHVDPPHTCGASAESTDPSAPPSTSPSNPSIPAAAA